MELFRKYWIIILIGLVLRFFIAGATFHPDVRTTALSSTIVFQDLSFNFYTDSGKIAPVETLDDLPLSYLINLPFHLTIRPFISLDIEKAFLNNTNELFGNPGLWLYLVYIKLPMILFDIMLGILLVALVSPVNQKKVLCLWLFNPFTIWVTSAIGQADIYPAFFILLAGYFIKKNNLSLAAISLGAGGAVKSAPFLLVPFLVALGKNWTERLVILVLAAVPYLLTVVPYLNVREFRQDALLAPQLSKSLYASLPLSGGEMILIAPTLLIVLYIFYFSKQRQWSDYLKFSTSALLLILSFTHFHIQWFLWVLPLLIIWFLENWNVGIKFSTVLLFVSLLLMLFLFESSLQMKLLAPIIPALDQAIGLKEILSDQQGMFLKSIAASLFAGSSLFIVWKILK